MPFVKPPSKLTTLRECLAGRGLPSECDAALGSLLRVLAASKPGGVCLHLGAGAIVYALWTLDGMDITSRLIVNLAPGSSPDLGPLGADLRVAVHPQAPLEFLADIDRHRFDVIVVAVANAGTELVARALERLRDGGFAVLLDSDTLPRDVLVPLLAGHVRTQLDATPGALLLTRTPPASRRRRRGGSRARHAG